MYVGVARIIVTLAGLLYASAQDWRRREVEDNVWMIMIVVGVPLTVYDLWLLGSLWYAILSLISIVVIIALALGVFYANLFGGADAKAFMAIGILNPLPPSVLQVPVSYPFFPLAVFNDSILLSLSAAAYVATRNLVWLAKGRTLFEGLESERWYRKLLAFFTGFKIDVHLLPSWKHHRLLTTEGHGRSTLVFLVKDEEQSSAIGEKQHVWITPLLPMIIYITLGYVVALLAGDIVLRIIFAFSAAFAG